MDGLVENSQRDDQLVEKDDDVPPPLVPDGDKHQLVEEDDDVLPPLLPDGDNHPDLLSNGWHPAYMAFDNSYCYYPHRLSMYPITAVPDLQKGERIIKHMVFVNALTGHYTSDSNQPVEEDDDEMPPPLMPDGNNHRSYSLSNGWHPVYMAFDNPYRYYPQMLRPSLHDGEGVENVWAWPKMRAKL